MMDYAQAQQYLANAIQVASTKVNRYYWRVSGNEANSLCRILLLGEEELKVLLRHCRIYQGANDNFSKNHFELLMLACKCEYTLYFIKKTREWFIEIGGHGEKAIVPKLIYNGDGRLNLVPVVGVHYILPRVVRATKSAPGASIPRLLKFGDDAPMKKAQIASDDVVAPGGKSSKNTPKSTPPISIQGFCQR
jgi:hypothetical protein